MKFFELFVVFAILAASTNAVQKKETLVLLDNLATRETHSIFFKSLQGKNSHRQPLAKGQLIEIEN